MHTIKYIRWLAIVVNICILAIVVFSFIHAIVENEIGEFREAMLFILLFPMINIAALLNLKKVELHIIAAVASLICNLIVILFMILMMVWPMGNLGHGWDLVAFWALFASVVYTQIAILICLIGLIRAFTKGELRKS